MVTLEWNSAAEWDGAASESGVAHESTANTDHNDATILKQGYPYSPPPFSTSLIAYYPLHEDSGSTANDLSGNGNDGTITGTTLGATGLLGTTAYDFDGVDDYVDLGTISTNLSSFTLAGWFQFDDTSSQQETICLSGNNDCYLGTRNGNYSVFVYNAGVFSVEGSAIGTSRIFLTGTWDGSTLRLYEDATEVGSTSVSNMDNAGRSDRLGSDTRGAGNYHDGRLSEVGIWDRSLSASEVQSLYDVATASGSLITAEKVK